MDPLKAPLTKISRTISKISTECSANRDKLNCHYHLLCLVYASMLLSVTIQELCLILRTAYMLLLVKLN